MVSIQSVIVTLPESRKVGFPLISAPGANTPIRLAPNQALNCVTSVSARQTRARGASRLTTFSMRSVEVRVDIRSLGVGRVIVRVPQQLDEPLDARVPQAFVVAEPVVGALERPGVDTAVVDASPNCSGDEASPLQGLDVLRGGGQRHPVRSGQVADGLLPPCEPLEHRPPGGVAEGAEHEIEAARTLNHVVEYVCDTGRL